ncbi:hypothetical protein tb265_17070 [Gemmatimonadetes bacterium T265]|nr:hypothetical protein tb265_17070 [Gemmatimonadetes bacterium T265]
MSAIIPTALPPGEPVSSRLFPSYFLAGFECSTHRLRAHRPGGLGRRLDVVASSGHEAWAAADYTRCTRIGIRTVREGLRWHLVERTPRHYDWSRELPRLRAARAAGVHVIWDLFHYGWPDDLDIFSPAFVDRFAAFSRAFAALHREESDAPVWVAPVNEPSFIAWGGGDVGYLNPFQRGRGGELKRQLARAAVAACAAVRDVDPRARLCHIDPVIHIVPNPARPGERGAADAHRLGMFEAWDMIAGRREPALGGDPRWLDVVGVNYYERNQWVHRGRVLPPGDPLHRPFADILAEVHARYGRPLFVAETGREGELRPAWLRYVAGEVRRAVAAGLPVEGICWYPILNHPGWDDDRHLTCGLWDYPPDAAGGRPVYEPLLEELERQQALFGGEEEGTAVGVGDHMPGC